MKKIFKIFVFLILLTVLAWQAPQLKQILAGASSAPAASPPPAAAAKGPGGPMPVGVVPVSTQDLEVTIDAVGTLSASESAEIRAEIAGAVRAIHFEEGQPVKKGESLIEIDDSLIRAELMKAEAAYNVRKTTFNRSDKLKSSGYVSNQDWEQNQGSLQEAAADIASSRIRLDKTKVRSPFNGIAGLRDFSVGDYLQVGQLLTTLDAIDPVKIAFSVPERNYRELHTGQKISFFVDAWPKEAFSGEIYAVSPRVDQSTRSFEVKATIPNPEGRLRPGMFARVSISSALHKDALLVPEEALIPKGEESFIFVVREGKAVLQKVVLGLRRAGSVEILSGLSAGEPVVVAGILKIQDGMPVIAMPQQKEGAQQEGAPPVAEEKTSGADKKGAAPPPPVQKP